MLWSAENDYDLGERLFEDVEIPESLIYFIDYEKKGRQFVMDTSGVWVTGGYFEY